MPEFRITYAGRMNGKCPLEYLLSNAWVATLKSTVKGVSFGAFEKRMIDEAKWLMLAMLQPLDLHIVDLDRVNISRLWLQYCAFLGKLSTIWRRSELMSVSWFIQRRADLTMCSTPYPTL